MLVTGEAHPHSGHLLDWENTRNLLPSHWESLSSYFLMPTPIYLLVTLKCTSLVQISVLKSINSNPEVYGTSLNYFKVLSLTWWDLRSSSWALNSYLRSALTNSSQPENLGITLSAFLSPNFHFKSVTGLRAIASLVILYIRDLLCICPAEL